MWHQVLLISPLCRRQSTWRGWNQRWCWHKPEDDPAGACRWRTDRPGRDFAGMHRYKRATWSADGEHQEKQGGGRQRGDGGRHPGSSGSLAGQQQKIRGSSQEPPALHPRTARLPAGDARSRLQPGAPAGRRPGDPSFLPTLRRGGSGAPGPRAHPRRRPGPRPHGREAAGGRRRGSENSCVPVRPDAGVGGQQARAPPGGAERDTQTAAGTGDGGEDAAGALCPRAAEAGGAGQRGAAGCHGLSTNREAAAWINQRVRATWRRPGVPERKCTWWGDRIHSCRFELKCGEVEGGALAEVFLSWHHNHRPPSVPQRPAKASEPRLQGFIHTQLVLLLWSVPSLCTSSAILCTFPMLRVVVLFFFLVLCLDARPSSVLHY